MLLVKISLNGDWQSMSSLKEQAVNSAKWTTARTVITTITGPLLLMVKTRYLTPGEFGVMAIINIFINLIAVLENFGFNTAIVRSDKVTKDERSSLFMLQIITSMTLAGLLVIVSPYIASIYDMGSLASLLPILSLSILFNSPVILFTAFLEKEFHFKELSIIQILREITLLVSTTVLFQFMENHLLAVVIGQIIAVGFMAISIIGVSFRYDLLHLRLHFRFSEVKPFFRFGMVIAAKQMLIQITHNIDELIIGLFLDESILGYYHFAKNLLNKFRQILTMSFSKVLLPILSKVKNEKIRLFNGYKQISIYIAAVTLPVFTGIALTTNSFIPILFEERWLASADFFIILAIGYIPYIISVTIGTNLLYSINKPRLALQIDTANNLTYIVLLFLLSWAGAGIYTIVLLYGLYLLVKSLIIQHFVYKEFGRSLWDYLKMFKGLAISTIIMITVVLGAQVLILNHLHVFIDLVISIVLGALSYIVSLYLIERQTFNDLLGMVMNRF